MSKEWIQCYSGGRIFPLNPQIEDIHLPDIAHALSNLCRYTGQGRWYSVAEHSVLVSRFASKQCAFFSGDKRCITCARWGLIHDAAEAYIGDLNAPTKHQFQLEAYRKAEAKLSHVIARRFALAPFEPVQVTNVDKAIRNNEVLFVFKKRHPEWELGAGIPGAKIHGWEPKRAEREFLKRYREVFLK